MLRGIFHLLLSNGRSGAKGYLDVYCFESVNFDSLEECDLLELADLSGKIIATGPDSETETETVRINDTTTRTVVRTYTWDGASQSIAGDVDGNSIAGGNDGRMMFTIAQTPAFVTDRLCAKEISMLLPAGACSSGKFVCVHCSRSV